MTLSIFILIFAAAFATGMILLGPADRYSELSAYDDSWDDVSSYRKGIKDMDVNVSNIISSPTMLYTLSEAEKKNTVYVALGIEKEYTLTEAYAIYDFFLSGGKLIIADDYGYGNSLSNRGFSEGSPGFGVEFLGARLWDNTYDKNPIFVKIPVNHMGFSGTILLNEPTAFRSGKESRVRASSSPTGASWVDVNGNGERDEGEYRMAERRENGFPVIIELQARLESGDMGRALFISDPSLFLNDMWDRENNSDFSLHIVEYLLGSDSIGSGKALVLFDESRHYTESAIPALRRDIYSWVILGLTDTNVRILAPVVIVMLLLILIIVVDNPPRLRHRFDIKHISLYNLRTPNIHSSDANRVRALFLEKIRLSSGMNMNEFKNLSTAGLAGMVGNHSLAEFLLDWDRSYSVVELENLLVAVRDWKPHRYTRGDENLD